MDRQGKPAKRAYDVESVARACRLLAAFREPGSVERLRDLAASAGLHTATAFRILHTLEQHGLVERAGRAGYRSSFRLQKNTRYRFGYASQGEDSAFAQEWSVSIVQAAREENVELLEYDNGVKSEAALANVERMVREKVDLAIEHQFNEQIAPIISARLLAARIPLIAMGTAHAGATYFGGNNYEAGLIAGRGLAAWAKKKWSGRVDQLLLVEMKDAGPLLGSRLTGIEVGAREVLPQLPETVRLAGAGGFGDSMEFVRRHLRRTRARRILLGAVNDPTALGALRAFEEAGWEEDCAVVGQGGAVEARRELRRKHTRLVGTVAFFPEKYGPTIMRIAFDLLGNRKVPPAIFTRHRLLTSQNVDHYYPNDTLLKRDPAA